MVQVYGHWVAKISVNNNLNFGLFITQCFRREIKCTSHMVNFYDTFMVLLPQVVLIQSHYIEKIYRYIPKNYKQ